MKFQNKKLIIAIDGHDYSGKTTIAHLLAERLNGKYVKPYQDSLGDIIAWLHKQRNYDFANKLAITAVKKVFGENCNEKCLIFDRLWLSMFAILPKKYRIDWYPLQTTFLCWADNKTSKKRLKQRGEHESYKFQIEKYCKIYLDISTVYNVPVINTSGNSDPVERVEEILQFINH